MSDHGEGSVEASIEHLLLLDKVFKFLGTAEEGLVVRQVLSLQVRGRDEHIGWVVLLED